MGKAGLSGLHPSLQHSAGFVIRLSPLRGVLTYIQIFRIFIKRTRTVISCGRCHSAVNVTPLKIFPMQTGDKAFPYKRIETASRMVLLVLEKNILCCRISSFLQSWYFKNCCRGGQSGKSSWLLIQRTWLRFPALPNFLRSRGLGTGFTQPRE
jgi:hypothetical protein